MINCSICGREVTNPSIDFVCPCGKAKVQMRGQMTEFKDGDEVEAFGLYGKIVAITDTYVEVKFSIPNTMCFELDGRRESWHLEPSLKLIERPKKKVTKTVEAWANVYADDTHYRLIFPSKKTADDSAAGDRIACVCLTGSYEVEE